MSVKPVHFPKDDRVPFERSASPIVLQSEKVTRRLIPRRRRERWPLIFPRRRRIPAPFAYCNFSCNSDVIFPVIRLHVASSKRIDISPLDNWDIWSAAWKLENSKMKNRGRSRCDRLRDRGKTIGYCLNSVHLLVGRSSY